MKDYINLLKVVDLFKFFSIDELSNLMLPEFYTITDYKKNAIVHFQNEKCTGLDVILKGSLVVQKIDSSGNVLTISDFTTNDILGGNLIFSHKNFYPMTILTKSAATIMHIDKSFILKLCQTNVNFLEHFLQSISDKTMILTDKINALTMKSVRQRIVEFLLYEYYVQQSTNIKLNLSKKELAEKFGIQRPSLSRELAKMRKDGLVEYDAHSIIIKDLNYLKDFTKY